MLFRAWSGTDFLRSQRSNNCRHALDREIDIGIGRGAAKAETDGGAGAVADGTDRLQDVRGGLTARAARRTGRHGQVPERHQERLTLDILETDVEVVREPSSAGRTVQPNTAESLGHGLVVSGVALVAPIRLLQYRSGVA